MILEFPWLPGEKLSLVVFRRLKIVPLRPDTRLLHGPDTPLVEHLSGPYSVGLHPLHGLEPELLAGIVVLVEEALLLFLLVDHAPGRPLEGLLFFLLLLLELFDASDSNLIKM